MKMKLYRYHKESLTELEKQDLLSEYRLVIQSLATTRSYDKINFYSKYQEDIEEEIVKRMK